MVEAFEETGFSNHAANLEADELAKVKAVEGSSVAERGDRWGKVLSPCAATDTATTSTSSSSEKWDGDEGKR